jgi:hypothetical protein
LEPNEEKKAIGSYFYLYQARHGLMPILLATWEAKIRRITV